MHNAKVKLVLRGAENWCKTGVLRSNNVPGYCRPFSQSITNAKVTEVEIPTRTSFLAGKLWEGTGPGEPVKEPPILCLHGWLDNCNTFDPLLPLVMRPGRVAYALDLPGHGRSPLSTTGIVNTNFEIMVGVERVMRNFGWEKVTLIGHSMGSIVSFNFSGIFPEFVTGYLGMDVIRAIPMDYIKTVRRLLMGTLMVEQKLALKKDPPSYTYDEIVQRTYKGRKESVSIEGCKILLERGTIKLPDGKYRYSHDLRVTVPTTAPISDAVSKEIAKNIKCPVCIIKGDPGEYYEPKEQFYKFISFLKTNVKNFEFHYVKGTHHFHLNDPTPVAPIVNKFLDVTLPQALAAAKESEA